VSTPHADEQGEECDHGEKRRRRRRRRKKE
jgi:hypothetical protein